MPPKKNYDWSQFTLRAAIAAPPAKVFNMWTNEKMLMKWFLADAKGPTLKRRK